MFKDLILKLLESLLRDLKIINIPLSYSFKSHEINLK